MNIRLGDAWLKLWSSLFLKILVVLVIAAGAINWITTHTVRLAREAEQRTRGNYVRQLAGHLQSELGNPPEEAVASKLAQTGQWHVAFVPSQEGLAAWATHPDMPQPEELKADLIGTDWGMHNSSFFYLGSRPSGTLVMMTPPRNESLGWTFSGVLVGGLLMVMLAVWLAVGWLLKPIRWLDQGVSRVAAGELAHRIPTRENDELGRLAMQFNAMTTQVQSMLEQRRQMLLDVSHELRTPLTLLARDTAADFNGREPGLKLELPPSLLLMGDKVRLQRLLQNLLANAFNHGQPARGPVSVRLQESAGEACLTVVDQGPGVPLDQLQRLFTPFYRGDNSRTRATGGVGLGLPLCLGVARAHGGDLFAAFAPGGGLAFTLTLPLA